MNKNIPESITTALKIAAARDAFLIAKTNFKEAEKEYFAKSERIAAALARELFPPMAKALVWDEEPTPFEGGHRYSYGSFFGNTLYQCGMYLDGSHFARIRAGNDFLYGSTREEVKARCEAHHQARWLEQMA
jgi:hypothetical protein